MMSKEKIMQRVFREMSPRHPRRSAVDVQIKYCASDESMNNCEYGEILLFEFNSTGLWNTIGIHHKVPITNTSSLNWMVFFGHRKTLYFMYA